MEKSDSADVTPEQVERFLSDTQLKRKDKPLTPHEETILIGAFVQSQREHVSVLDALKLGRDQTKESHIAQRNQHSSDKPYMDSLKSDLRIYNVLIKLFSTKS